MKSFNEQFEQFSEIQRKNFEPVQQFNAVYAEVFERIARKNYDLMGDMVEYTVAQVQVPSQAGDAQSLYETQAEQTKAFAEKINSRAAEYMELAGELGELMTNGVTDFAEATVKKVEGNAKKLEAEVKDDVQEVKSATKKTASRRTSSKSAA